VGRFRLPQAPVAEPELVVEDRSEPALRLR
jgi:hypothetical protein